MILEPCLNHAINCGIGVSAKRGGRKIVTAVPTFTVLEDRGATIVKGSPMEYLCREASAAKTCAWSSHDCRRQGLVIVSSRSPAGGNAAL
eukprot:6966995-Alexandrium_andersonii.AAC.1